MPRKGKAGQSNRADQSTSLRAKAAANAAAAHATAAHNNSFGASTGANAQTHPQSAASASGSGSPSGGRRQRDPPGFDEELMLAYEDAEQDMHDDDGDDDDGVNEQEDHDDGNHGAGEASRAASTATVTRPTATRADAEGDDVEMQELDHADIAALVGAGAGGLGSGSDVPLVIEEDDEDDHEGHDEEDEDDEDDGEGEHPEDEDDLGHGDDGEMLDEDFDVPLTFDADGNPIHPGAGTGSASGTAAGTAARLAPSSGSSAGSADAAGFSAARPGAGAASSAAALAAAAAAADDGFGSFAASLRGYSGLMANMSSRLRGLLTNLRNKSDASVRMVALQELSELLSMSTEDTLAGYFSVDAFVRELVSCLKGSGGTSQMMGLDEDDDYAMAQAIAASHDAGFGGVDDGGNADEMQLLACRCLANLIEAMPTSAHNIVQNGAVPVLCSKLFEITFIDLAEQTISVSAGLEPLKGREC